MSHIGTFYRGSRPNISSSNISSPFIPPQNGFITGGIYGGELVYNTTSSINIKGFSCYSDESTTELKKDDITPLSISTSPNTIYNIFAVKTDSGVITCMYDVNIDGSGLSSITAKRWLGFVRVNGSSEICGFTMQGDFINFHVASDNVLSTSIGTTYSSVDHSDLLPIERIELIEYGTRDPSGNYYMHASDDGGNTVSFFVGVSASRHDDDSRDSWAINATQKASLKPFLSTRMFTANITSDLLCQAVKLKR